MKKTILLTMTTLTFFSILPHSAIATTKDNQTLEEAQKAHPNAQFKVNKDNGTYTYTYDKNSVPNSNQQSQSRTSENNQRTNQRDHNTNQYHSPLNDQYTNINDAIDSHTPPQTPPSNPLTPATPNIESNDDELNNAFSKDKKGLITGIDLDELYDELQIAEFNDKAKTADGKPLALGNGKIIDQPLFTSKNNLYTAGQCTWYVFDKRAKEGHTISTFWGDAKNWAGQAASNGFKVDRHPTRGSILQTVNGPFGHVAYVEKVNIDGSILISEMNWVGEYIVSSRTISASEVSSYNYIH
ncbi:CHAP domain-containing protein [Staphylococcus sp. SS251]|nr:CHAP domain-containing protein [Staphylococcus singaporensis]MBE5677583.1 CHAP domain-containing protein [Staphylococcus singaporensis]